MPLVDIPPGTTIHNVELIEGNGGKLGRSAGSSVTLSGFDGDYSIIKLSSGETRKVRSLCKATIGSVSNPEVILKCLVVTGILPFIPIPPKIACAVCSCATILFW